LRRGRTVDLDLGLASGFTFFERGKIKKRKADCALDLEGTLARQKDRSRMGVDALDRAPAMSGGIGQQRQDWLLRVDRGVHGLPTFRLAGHAAWEAACAPILRPFLRKSPPSRRQGWNPVFRPKCDNAKMLERFLFPANMKPLQQRLRAPSAAGRQAY